MAIIHGTNGDESIPGTSAADRMFGYGGDDAVQGSAGADTIYGGSGNDFLLSSYDPGDRLNFDGAVDRLFGGDGIDLLIGDDDADALYGGRGIDYVYGGRGNDTVHGGGGADDVSGGDANDRVLGGDGNDRLDGREGKDVLVGGTGRDLFFFEFVFHSASGATRDELRAGDGGVAFSGAGAANGDLIDLSSIDANEDVAGFQSFVFGGTGTGHLWRGNVGTVTHFYGNIDGDGAPEFEFAIFDGAVLASAYTAADFLL